MKDITTLQNIVVDRSKIAEVLRHETPEAIQQLFGVKRSQAYNIKTGEKNPSVDGLLRLMVRYGLKPHDLLMERR